MATPLVGSKQIIFQEDVDFNSANSEALQTKISKAALFSQDIAEYVVALPFGGYFTDVPQINESARFVVTKRSELKRYTWEIGDTGTGTANQVNVLVYDDTGAFVNRIFSGDEPSIQTGSAQSNVFVGRDIAASTTLEGNTGSATISYGTTNLTTLEEGYQLVGEIVNSGAGARNACLNLILQRIE